MRLNWLPLLAALCVGGVVLAGCGAGTAPVTSHFSAQPPSMTSTAAPTAAPTPTPTATPTPDLTAGWKTLSLSGAATIKYPQSWHTYDCGDGWYYAGEHTWWIGPDQPGGCAQADTLAAPIEITLAAQLRPADTDTSGCGGMITRTQVTIDGLAGTRYAEGPCTTNINYPDKSPDLYYVFTTPRGQFLFDYHEIGLADLTRAFDTMVRDGLQFTS